MPIPKFGNRKTSQLGGYTDQEVFPERKVITFRDFRAGYIPSEQRQVVPDNASPKSHDMIVRKDNRLQGAPGTTPLVEFLPTDLINPIEGEGIAGYEPQEDYDYQYNPATPTSFTPLPKLLDLHPTLTELVELVMVDPPLIGFRDNDQNFWYNLGLVDRGEFAATTFGGTYIFTDGLKVWYRTGPGATPKPIPDAPPARDYCSFAGRVFAFGTLIGGRWEPLGVRWIAASSDYRDWEGLGSGFELLVNDVSSGDRIVAALPMNLDLIAVMMRNSIWIGRFTGNFLRPADFSPRVPGLGAVNKRVCKLSRFGVIFLSDSGVYLFDGNGATSISKSIDAELLPLDQDNIDLYHAVYDPTEKRYILFTPTVTWIYEIEYQRWHKRSFTCLSSVMWPRQIDGERWFEILGDWLSKGQLVWKDLAGRNLGDLSLYMLGDHFLGDEYADDYYQEGLIRTIETESDESGVYFGRTFLPYWETKLIDEQDASFLITIVKQIIEYEGVGGLRVYLPDRDNQYRRVIEVGVAERDFPATLVLNAESVAKGTGIGIEFLPAGELIVPLPACPVVTADDFPEFS